MSRGHRPTTYGVGHGLKDAPIGRDGGLDLSPQALEERVNAASLHDGPFFWGEAPAHRLHDLFDPDLPFLEFLFALKHRHRLQLLWLRDVILVLAHGEMRRRARQVK